MLLCFTCFLSALGIKIRPAWLWSLLASVMLNWNDRGSFLKSCSFYCAKTRRCHLVEAWRDGCSFTVVQFPMWVLSYMYEHNSCFFCSHLGHKPVLLQSQIEKRISDALLKNPLLLWQSNVSVVECFLGYPFIQLSTQAFTDKFCIVKQAQTSFVYLKRRNDVLVISENVAASVAHNVSQLHHLFKQSTSKRGFWKSWAAKDWSFVVFLYLILSFAVKGTCS